MNRQDSIISISDSDTSLEQSVIDDTCSMKYTTANEIDETIQNMYSVKEEHQDDGEDDDVITETPPRTMNYATPMLRKSHTPKRLHEVTLKYFSPEPCVVPDIVIVPPSTDRKRIRRCNKTPSKTKRISLTTYRRSRIYATPLRTVGEEDKSRSSPAVIANDTLGATMEDPLDLTIKASADLPLIPEDLIKTESVDLSTAKIEDSTFKKPTQTPSRHKTPIKEIVDQEIKDPKPEKTPVSLDVPHKMTGKVNKPHLLSPKIKTISKKSPLKGPKYSAKKIKAIIIQSTDFKASPRPRSVMVATPVTVKGRSHVEAKQVTAKKTDIKEPRVFAKDLHIKLIKNKNLTPTRPVATISPFKMPKVESPAPVSSPLAIRGVRLNRRFELLIKHRNNVNEKK